MAWYLTYFDRSRHIVPISNIPQVCDQNAYGKAVEIARRIWLSIQACDPDTISCPEIVWKEPLEDADIIRVKASISESTSIGIHWFPDETAEYEWQEREE